MSEDEAEIKVQDFISYVRFNEQPKYTEKDWLLAIETILAQLEKKDKIIKLMIKHLCNVIDNDNNASLLPFYDSDDNLEEKVKEYFERKAENE